MSKIAELNEENFDQVIAATTTPVVVDVYAPWCGPCKMLTPLMEQLADHFVGHIRFFKVNVDEAPGIARHFQIKGVPTLLLFSDGKLRDTIVGLASPRALLTKLEALAANATEVGV